MKRQTAKQRIAQRQAANARLAEEDAKHRCGFCKQALPMKGVVTGLGLLRMFCSVGCLSAALDAIEASGR